MDKLKKFAKSEAYRFVLQAFNVIVAGILGGVAFKTFFEPSGIIPTGFSGLSVIIHNALLSVVNIPTAVIYTFINVILFLLALRLFGWRFLALSLIGTAAYILSMQFGYIEALANSSTEKLLFAVVGGVISGSAIGFGLRSGGSTGGTDIAGAIINKKFPNIKAGSGILIINVIVLTLSVITVGVQTGLYALVIAVISSISTNVVLNTSKRVVAYYIICDKDEELAQVILDKYHRGITKINAEGMFSKKEKKLLLCILPYEQSLGLKKLVKTVDENAFVFSESVDETVGDGKFLLEESIFKNKVKSATASLKNKNKYTRCANTRKLNYPRRKTRLRMLNNNSKPEEVENKTETEERPEKSIDETKEKTKRKRKTEEKTKIKED